MQDYAAYLAEEAKSNIAALHQFRILFDPGSDDCHLFFEGEDDALFYMPETRRQLGGRAAHVYDCGGKRSVVEVRDTIKGEGYDIRLCLFFVDRDFDDYLNTQVSVDDNTYMTDFYSIENDISSVLAARILVEDVVRISRADPEFSRIEEEFSTAFAVFYREVRPLMAWILAAKEAGLKPNLRNTNGLSGIVSLTGIRPRITGAGFATFKRKVVGSGQGPAIQNVLRWRRRLDLTSCKFWVRGKYDIWFFQAALLATLEETSIRRKQAGGRAVRVPASLRDGRIFEILGGRVPPPESLRIFLEDRLQ